MDKLRKIIRIIVLICIILLIIDLLSFIIIRKNKSNIEIDTINAFSKIDDGFISVGSFSRKDDYESAKIIKYNDKLEKEFEYHLDKKYSSTYFNVINDKNNYIAVGNIEANKEEHDSYLRSALIAKYDDKGKLLKLKKFQKLGNSKFTDIVLCEDSYIVTGQSIYDNMVLGNSKNGGAYLIKYDKDLNIEWKVNYGGSKSAIYNNLLILDNYIYAVGKDASNYGIISKYDLDGNNIKTVSYEGTDSFGFTGIVTDDNYLYVTSSKSKEGSDSESLIIKYDKDLNVVKEKTFNYTGKDRFNNLIIDDNKLLIVGHSAIYNDNDTNIRSYFGTFTKLTLDLDKVISHKYNKNNMTHFTDINKYDNDYLISGYYDTSKGYKDFFILSNRLGGKK